MNTKLDIQNISIIFLNSITFLKPQIALIKHSKDD